MTFTQALNKLQNGNGVYRPSFPSGVYILIPPTMTNLYWIYPSNINNPALPYCPTVADLNATDWVEL